MYLARIRMPRMGTSVHESTGLASMMGVSVRKRSFPARRIAGISRELVAMSTISAHASAARTWAA